MGSKLRINTDKSKIEKDNKEKDFEEIISPTSAVFLQNLEEPPFSILAFFESEIPLDVQATYHFLQHEFLSTSSRFSSILIDDKDKEYKWEKVEVNVRDHVKIPTFPVGLSPQEYDKYLDNYISKIDKEHFSHDKPLWEVHLITYPTSNAAGIFMFKVHHVIADGFSLMSSVLSILRRVDNPSLPLTFLASRRPKDSVPSRGESLSKMNEVDGGGIGRIFNKFAGAIVNSITEFGEGVRRTIQEDDLSPIRSGEAHLYTHPYNISSLSFPLNDVKRIKDTLGVTVNDVVVGIIFLATKLYMKEMEPNMESRRSTAIIPVNVRSDRTYAHVEEMHKDDSKAPWGNKIQLLQLSIPNLDLNNPLNFVMETHRNIKAKRSSPGHYLFTKLTHLLSTFGGHKVGAQIFDRTWKNATMAITNMIGPDQQMSLANHPISGFYFMIVGVELSLTVTILSYMQKLRLGFRIEEDYIDATKLLKCVEKAFQLILEASKTNDKI